MASSSSTQRLNRLTVPSTVERLPLLEPGTQDAEAFAQKTAADPRGFFGSLKTQFAVSHSLLGLRIPGRQATKIQSERALKGSILRLAKVKQLLPDDAGDSSKRILLLNVPSLEDLDNTARDFVESAVARTREGTESSEGGYSVEPRQQHLTVDYNHWTADEVLSALLPLGMPEGTPTAFTSTGHIAHVNLRTEYLPYRHVIGQVILDKNSHNVRTVVNKLDTIDAQFRFFAMERLAGEDDYEVRLSEGGCTFTFDFRQVYWNSRLHAEHARLVTQFAPYGVVCDVMAGVGPFAIPAARKGCWVLANDLNPASHAALCTNAKLNHVEDRVRPACVDGREYIRQSIVECWKQPFEGKPLHANAGGPVKSSKERAREEHERRRQQRQKQEAASSTDSSPSAESKSAVAPASIEREPPRRLIDDFVMNLPASALEFLDAYRGAYKAIAGPELDAELERREKKGGESVLPMVHVHCFTKDLEHPHEDICRRASEILGLGEGPQRLVPPPSPPPDRRALFSTVVAANKNKPDSENDVTSEEPAALSSQPQNQEQNVPGSNVNGKDTATPTPELSLHYVRAVAPNKDMYCLSFRLTRAILFDEASEQS